MWKWTKRKRPMIWKTFSTWHTSADTHVTPTELPKHQPICTYQRESASVCLCAYKCRSNQQIQIGLIGSRKCVCIYRHKPPIYSYQPHNSAYACDIPRAHTFKAPCSAMDFVYRYACSGLRVYFFFSSVQIATNISLSCQNLSFSFLFILSQCIWLWLFA